MHNSPRLFAASRVLALQHDSPVALSLALFPCNDARYSVLRARLPNRGLYAISQAISLPGACNDNIGILGGLFSQHIHLERCDGPINLRRRREVTGARYVLEQARARPYFALKQFRRLPLLWSGSAHPRQDMLGAGGAELELRSCASAYILPRLVILRHTSELSLSKKDY